MYTYSIDQYDILYNIQLKTTKLIYTQTAYAIYIHKHIYIFYSARFNSRQHNNNMISHWRNSFLFKYQQASFESA